MPRVLVVGCGYVGEAASDFFHGQGWDVEGWTASAESAGRLVEKPYPVRAVNITAADLFAGAGDGFDVVIQSTSTRGGAVEDYRRLYLRGAQRLLHLYPAAKLIFTSSTSVYGQKKGEIVDEGSLADPDHEKGRVLREAEGIVLTRGGIVIRAGGIYGPGRSYLVRSVLEGKSIIDSGRDRFLNQVHRDDMVAAYFLLAEKRADFGGEIFNVVDDEPILASEAIQWLAERLRQSAPLSDGSTMRKRGATNKRVSNRKLRGRGWELRFPCFREGMTRSVLPSLGRSDQPGT